MTICFLARPTFDRFSVKILKYFRENYDASIRGFFITTNAKETQYVFENIDDVNVCETSKYLREHWNEFSFSRLAIYEEKYECKPIWKYIYTDRFLINRSYDYVVKMTVGLFSFFEEIFEKNTVDFFYSETIATLQCYIAYLVGKKYNVKYLAQMSARGMLDSTYHYFVTEEYQRNVDLETNYNEMEYSSEEMKYAEGLLLSFEEKDCPPPAMQMVKTRPHIDRSIICAPYRFLKKRREKELNDPYSYMYYKSYYSELNPILFFIRYRKMMKYCVAADYSEKYVYYPLHYQPEASTCVCAEKYNNQLFFIDNWAKSIPADTVLYVKEHYALLGSRNIDFYKALQKYPNVKLINPWESSRKLIEHSEAVTTLTGTAGLEAMLLRKPVIIGGNAVYRNAPGVIYMGDIFENYISAMESWKKPSREQVVKYLCACIRTYHKGNAYAQNCYEIMDECMPDLCDSLYKRMDDIMKDKTGVAS